MPVTVKLYVMVHEEEKVAASIVKYSMNAVSSSSLIFDPQANLCCSKEPIFKHLI